MDPWKLKNNKYVKDYLKIIVVPNMKIKKEG